MYNNQSPSSLVVECIMVSGEASKSDKCFTVILEIILHTRYTKQNQLNRDEAGINVNTVKLKTQFLAIWHIRYVHVTHRLAL